MTTLSPQHYTTLPWQHHMTIATLHHITMATPHHITMATPHHITMATPQEDTISINHNWINAFNIDISFLFLKQRLLQATISLPSTHPQSPSQLTPLVPVLKYIIVLNITKSPHININTPIINLCYCNYNNIRVCIV